MEVSTYLISKKIIAETSNNLQWICYQSWIIRKTNIYKNHGN